MANERRVTKKADAVRDAHPSEFGLPRGRLSEEEVRGRLELVPIAADVSRL